MILLPNRLSVINILSGTMMLFAQGLSAQNDLRATAHEIRSPHFTSYDSTIYISGPSAKDYIDSNLFEQNNIALKWMDYSDYKTYTQLSTPFEHGVSILDLIFNEGENSRFYLNY